MIGDENGPGIKPMAPRLTRLLESFDESLRKVAVDPGFRCSFGVNQRIL